MPTRAWAAGDSPSSDDLGGLPSADPSEPRPLVDPEPGGPREPERYDPVVKTSADKRNNIPGFVLLGIGAAGIGLGVAGIVVAGHQGTIAEREAAAIRKAGAFCQPTTPGFAAKCSAIADAASTHNTWQKVGRGGLAVGIACAAAGLVYLLWPEGRPVARKGSASLGLLPVASPTEAGLWVGGSF